MKITTKLVMALTLVALVIGVGTFFYRQYDRKMHDEIFDREDLERRMIVDGVIEVMGQSLETLSTDYSFWDEMVAFVASADPVWAKQNIETMFSVYKCNAVWIYNAKGALVYSLNDLQAKGALNEIPLPKAAWDRLFAGDNRLCHFFLSIPEGCLEIRGATIHPSADVQRKTAVVGTLFVGKLWNKQLTDRIGAICGAQAEIAATAEDPARLRESRLRTERYFRKKLKSWDGTPAAYLRVRTQSRMLTEFKKGSGFLFFVLIITVITLIGAIVVLLHRWVLTPLLQLSRALSSNSPADLSTLRNRKDEFSQVAGLIEDFFKQRDLIAEQQKSLTLEVGEKKRAEVLLEDALEKLRERMHEFEIINKTSLGREERIVELKQELEKLRRQLQKE